MTMAIESLETLDQYVPKLKEVVLAFVKDNEMRYGLTDIDISAPRHADMEKVRSGDFEIRALTNTPRSSGEGVNFHFYIGDTEAHVCNRAADEVLKGQQ